MRTFADCARYVLTTLMDLQAPPAPTVGSRFQPLFAGTQPDVSTKAGKVALLTAFKTTLKEWAATLRKFLLDEDDQFEMLLTLEEYCGEKGIFSGEGQVGRMYVPIFSNVLMQLYDDELIGEDVFLAWEKAKLDDDDDDQVRCCLAGQQGDRHQCQYQTCIHHFHRFPVNQPLPDVSSSTDCSLATGLCSPLKAK